MGRYAFYRPRPEAGLVAIPVADWVTRTDGGWSVGASCADNVRNRGSCIQAEDPGKPLALAYAVSGPVVAGQAFVSYCPCLTTPGQMVTVVATTTDGH